MSYPNENHLGVCLLTVHYTHNQQIIKRAFVLLAGDENGFVLRSAVSMSVPKFH
jgi:hypothetical protein